MAWMLQPHEYTQIIRRNLYSMPYRRTGAYKGMGQYTDPNVEAPLAEQYPGMTFPAALYPSATPAAPTAWTQYLPWIIGGVLVLGLIAGGRR